MNPRLSFARRRIETSGPLRQNLFKIATFATPLLFLALTACSMPRPDHPVIGAKNFTEQVVLGQ